jgi:hypothetical protein
MEWEGIYNYIIFAIFIVIIIGIAYIFVLKPATDKTQDQKNFEDTRSIFLARWCSNMGYNNYTFQDIGNYNFYCFTDSSPISRVVTYGRYDWTKNGNGYNFFILQEKR